MRRYRAGDIVRMFGQVGTVIEVQPWMAPLRSSIRVETSSGVSSVFPNEVELLLSAKEMRELVIWRLTPIQGVR